MRGRSQHELNKVQIFKHPFNNTTKESGQDANQIFNPAAFLKPTSAMIEFNTGVSTKKNKDSVRTNNRSNGQAYKNGLQNIELTNDLDPGSERLVKEDDEMYSSSRPIKSVLM